MATHGAAYAARALETARGKEAAAAAALAATGSNASSSQLGGGFGGTAARPLSASISARPASARTQQQGQFNGYDPSRPVAGAASFTPRFVAPSSSTRAVQAPVRSLATMTVLVPRQVRRVVCVEEVDGLTERDEEYEELELVPVRKTRRVQVPCKRLVQREVWDTVQVPEQRTVEVVQATTTRQRQLAPQTTTTVTLEQFRETNNGGGYRYTNGNGSTPSARPASARQPYSQQQQQQQPQQYQHQLQRPTTTTTASNAARGSGAGPLSQSQQLQAFHAPPPQPPQPQQPPVSSPTPSSSIRRPDLPAGLGFKVRVRSGAPGVVCVCGVDALGPAGRAGLRVGDLLLSLNGQSAASLQDLKSAVAAATRGPVLLHIKRGQNRMLVTLQR